MTLIAGIRCRDGFLVAADTAVTTGDTVYHGEKLDWFKGQGDKPYKLVIACAGDLTYGRMATENIRDAAAALTDLTTTSVRHTIVDVLGNIYSRRIRPYWDLSDADAPRFSLIVGIAIGDEFAVLISKDTAIEEVRTYAFQGSGHNVAQYLAETLLRSRGNSILSCPIATAVHLTIEIFRVAKLHSAAVGLDTQIIAFRSVDSIAPFSLPSNQFTGMQSEIGVIQENLKTALWSALERSSLPDPMFDMAVQNIGNTLRSIKKYTREQGSGNPQVRFIRYSLMPTTGEWSMGDMDPNAQLPP